jgi:hypothetical protein
LANVLTKSLPDKKMKKMTSFVDWWYFYTVLKGKEKYIKNEDFVVVEC